MTLERIRRSVYTCAEEEMAGPTILKSDRRGRMEFPRGTALQWTASHHDRSGQV